MEKTINKITLIITFLFILLNISCKAQTNNKQSKAEKIETLLNRFAEHGKFYGAVLVAEEGKVIYKKGFGYANMEWEIPNKPNTKIRIASVTKQFTAMLILQLVAENKLDLHKPITTYLPNYPKEKAKSITIHHLLTHTSGTPRRAETSDYKHYQPKQMVDLIAGLELEFQPGEKFMYSNSGYTLLGYIIEKVTQKSFEENLKEKIFKPLKMNNSGLDNNKTIIKNRASGYQKNYGDIINAKYIDMSIPYAAGSIYSTVEDLFLWNQTLYTEKLLPKKYVDLLFGNYIEAYGGHYSYGFVITDLKIGNTNEKVATIGHSGGMEGFRSLNIGIPSTKSSIILLSNFEKIRLFDINTAIMGILLDKTYDIPKKSVALSLLDIVERDGLTKAISHFNKVKDNNDYYLNEDEMNIVGYKLMKADKSKKAIAVFELNTKAFPNSWNVYDSYGELLKNLGKKTEAIKNYKKSVKLNPGNQNGLKMLEELGVDINNIIYKVSVKNLKLLEGKYYAENDEDWLININIINDKLQVKERNMQYDLFPISDTKFVNQNFGASLEFNTKDINKITFLYSNRTTFIKMK